MNVEIGGIELGELKNGIFFMKYKNIFFINGMLKKTIKLKINLKKN